MAPKKPRPLEEAPLVVTMPLVVPLVDETDPLPVVAAPVAWEPAPVVV